MSVWIKVLLTALAFVLVVSLMVVLVWTEYEIRQVRDPCGHYFGSGGATCIVEIGCLKEADCVEKPAWQQWINRMPEGLVMWFLVIVPRLLSVGGGVLLYRAFRRRSHFLSRVGLFLIFFSVLHVLLFVMDLLF